MLTGADQRRMPKRCRQRLADHDLAWRSTPISSPTNPENEIVESPHIVGVARQVPVQVTGRKVGAEIREPSPRSTLLVLELGCHQPTVPTPLRLPALVHAHTVWVA